MDPGVTQESPLGRQPSGPPNWQQPRRSLDPMLLVGGILVFVGYLLFGVGNFGFLMLPIGMGSIFFGVGEIIVATGFLLAFVGLARRL